MPLRRNLGGGDRGSKRIEGLLDELRLSVGGRLNADEHAGAGEVGRGARRVYIGSVSLLLLEDELKKRLTTVHIGGVYPRDS